MAHARANATATLLRDGTVLVAGGWAGTGPLGTAELYDPASRSFSPTGSMQYPRSGHTATLLLDGRVLVIGGNGVAGTPASAELYDPIARTFTTVGSLATGRSGHTATLIHDGRILVAGGFNTSCSPTSECASAELYDPASRRFMATGSMAHARGAHTASMLPGGNVLIAGGRRGNFWSVEQAELYDPAAGGFSPSDTMYNAGRQLHTATPLRDGRVVLIGGAFTHSTAGGEAGCKTVEIFYSPVDGFKLGASLLQPRAFHTATLLADGRILVAGGADGFDITNEAEVGWP